jgi:hypothetical protein
MEKRKFEAARPIPMDASRVQKQSTATIRYIVDAIVELVTNSDDSYRRLEADGHRTCGEIKIHIRRLKGGTCERLEVIDFAEGMDRNELEKALTFAGATSGFEERRSVRGLFGRGLKEVITALGRAEIYSIKHNELCITNVWWDAKKGLMYEPLENPCTPSKEEREEIGVVEGNGTSVRIAITNEKIKCPLLGNLVPQIRDYYALRDINSSRNRKITLEFEYVEKKTEKMVETIFYESPKTEKTIFENTIPVPGYRDQVQVIMYESKEELENPYNNPQARAGLLIKTSGAILDNQLFKYQSEDAGRFFFGEVVCEGLAERIREGDWGIITPDRTGINWRHQYCETLRKTLEDILTPYIEDKKKQLEVKPTKAPSEKTKKMLNKVCSLLNRLVKEELSEVPDIEPGKEPLKELTIVPEQANIQKERIFCVYAPLDILDTPLLEYYQAEAKSNNPYIQVLDPIIKVKVHRKYPDLYYYGKFRVTGSIKDEKATITCTLGEHTATAKVRVAELKPRGKRGKPERKGGFFREIKADSRENPDQRASYDQNNGIIWIFVRFPVVAKYLDESLSPETREGKTMLAELVGEVYCRLTAREKIERGIEYITLTDPIDSFYRAVTDLQKKSLHLIHEAVFKHTL